MNEPVIQTTNLSRDFAGKMAVNDISLSVPAGTVMALLGPNGAGKTTLLRLLRGLLEPSSGHAQLLGAPSRALPEGVSGKVACQLEDHEPPGWARIRQLLHLQAEAAQDFDLRLAERLLVERELAPGKRYGTLSKGQKRWVLSTLALASGAKVVLLDEPADGLDVEARRALYDLIRDQANELGTTLMVATHILGDIERVADDIAIIHRGRLALNAALEDLREEVRELELDPEASLPEWGDDVTVLKDRTTDGVRCVWIRGTELNVPAHVPARPVTLETLYLILTENRTGSALHHQEPATAI